MNAEQRVGLTPMIMRVAVGFLTRGVGEYEEEVFGYDKVEVKVTRAWENTGVRGNLADYSQEVEVAFYKAGRRERWVDFVVSVSGGGGGPFMMEVL